MKSYFFVTVFALFNNSLSFLRLKEVTDQIIPAYSPKYSRHDHFHFVEKGFSSRRNFCSKGAPASVASRLLGKNGPKGYGFTGEVQQISCPGENILKF